VLGILRRLRVGCSPTCRFLLREATFGGKIARAG